MRFVLIFLPVLALAGHSMWEPKRKHVYKRDLSSAGHLEKKWFVISNFGIGSNAVCGLS